MENTKSLRLFSEETLNTIVMSEIYGGTEPNPCTYNENCANCGNCYQGCATNPKTGCSIEVNTNFVGKCDDPCAEGPQV